MPKEQWLRTADVPRSEFYEGMDQRQQEREQRKEMLRLLPPDPARASFPRRTREDIIERPIWPASFRHLEEPWEETAIAEDWEQNSYYSKRTTIVAIANGVSIDVRPVKFYSQIGSDS